MIIYADPKVLATSFRDFRLACRGDVLPVRKNRVGDFHAIHDLWRDDHFTRLSNDVLDGPAVGSLAKPWVSETDRLRTNPRCIGQFPCETFRKLV